MYICQYSETQSDWWINYLVSGVILVGVVCGELCSILVEGSLKKLLNEVLGVM